MDKERLPPGLDGGLIGRRVVIRRVVRGETGPSGGPALTDVLGVMESWFDGVTTVRGESGEVTRIRIADIVSGKPVPPRPPVRMRVSAEDAERRACAGWPASVTEPLGDWLLRASGGFSSRANSVLAVGQPGVSFADALDLVTGFYARHSLPAVAQVVVGSQWDDSFADAGWVSARPGRSDSLFRIASVSRAVRAVGRLRAPGRRDDLDIRIGTHLDESWLAGDERALSHGTWAAAVLEGPDEVGLLSISNSADPARVIAKGRAAYDRDWVGVTDVWVSPEHRRQGLGLLVMGTLLDWGAERGATTAYLQTSDDNPAAMALYDELGFATHHAYRYLTAG